MRVAVLVALCSSAALLEAFHLTSLSSLANSDVWWHLQAGSWILQNHAFPHSGLFSQSASLPWIDTSWAYDVLLSLFYRLVGLRAIPVLAMLAKISLAVITFLLARRVLGNFTCAVLLSAAAQYLLFDRQALPVYFSILAFAVELLLLMEVRRSGKVTQLLWLPVMFIVWTNVDPGFVYGLLLLGLFLVSLLIEHWVRSAGIAWLEADASLPVALVGVVTALSVLATFLTPYGYHTYTAVLASFGGAADKYFPDLHSIGFRRPQDYMLLLLTMASFLALGRRRSRSVFHVALLVGTVLLSFHRQRDAWLVVLASVAILADTISGGRVQKESKLGQGGIGGRWIGAGAAAATLIVVLIFVAAWLRIPEDNELLQTVVAKTYPVAAADYISTNQLPRPLFNNYEWGGFLEWYLPTYPVAIDGRRNLYGDDDLVRYFKAIDAESTPAEYPALADARTLILPRHSLMGQALSNIAAFRVLYQDDVAVILTRTN